MRLLVESGEHCELLLDERLRDLPCQSIEADEIWTYVRKRQGNLEPHDDDEAGDQYTFLTLDPLWKLIAAHVTGRRTAETAADFITLIRDRIPGRIELFTDGWNEYLSTIDEVFDERTVHYAQVIKPQFGAGLKIVRQFGGPDPEAIGTSYVERHNATLRQQVRRLTRKTLAFSKKLRNLQPQCRSTWPGTTGVGSGSNTPPISQRAKDLCGRLHHAAAADGSQPGPKEGSLVVDHGDPARRRSVPQPVEREERYLPAEERVLVSSARSLLSPPVRGFMRIFRDARH